MNRELWFDLLDCLPDQKAADLTRHGLLYGENIGYTSSRSRHIGKTPSLTSDALIASILKFPWDFAS